MTLLQSGVVGSDVEKGVLLVKPKIGGLFLLGKPCNSPAGVPADLLFGNHNNITSVRVRPERIGKVIRSDTNYFGLVVSRADFYCILPP